MREIDEVIDKHSGWPDAFATASGDTKSGSEGGEPLQESCLWWRKVKSRNKKQEI